MRISAPSSSVQSWRSGLSTVTSPTVWMSPAVTAPGPCFFTTMRFGPSPCILIEMSLMLSTMSVTSSRTPAIEENSCSTPSMCTDCTAAPCSEDSRMRRSALPSGLAEATLERLGDDGGEPARVRARRHLQLVRSNEFLPIFSGSSLFHPFAGHRATREAVPGVGDRGSVRAVNSKTIAGRPGPPATCRSNAPTLARTAAIVRDRGHVADRGDGEARGLQRAQRRLTARNPGLPLRPPACACRVPAPSWRRLPPRPARHRGSTCASP